MDQLKRERWKVSTNDIYRIEEEKDGSFCIYHEDAEGDGPSVYIGNGTNLRDATRLCDEAPAEYGYYIAWVDDRDGYIAPLGRGGAVTFGDEDKEEVDWIDDKIELDQAWIYGR